MSETTAIFIFGPAGGRVTIHAPAAITATIIKTMTTTVAAAIPFFSEDFLIFPPPFNDIF
jgi:hypothetical protein